LIAKGVVNGKQRGWLYVGSNSFESDAAAEANWSKSQLLTAAAQPGHAVTFTCVPPGSGRRMGIDRDGDAVRDLNDTAACSAGRMGTPERRDLGAFSLLTVIGLTLLRRRRRRESHITAH
jgi:MYXO-CTERM domain-containing protein